MNQQQLIEQKAKAILQNSFDKNIKPLIPITFKEAEGENGYNWIYEAMQEYGEWMQGEGERLRSILDRICAVLADTSLPPQRQVSNIAGILCDYDPKPDNP